VIEQREILYSPEIANIELSKNNTIKVIFELETATQQLLQVDKPTKLKVIIDRLDSEITENNFPSIFIVVIMPNCEITGEKVLECKEVRNIREFWLTPKDQGRSAITIQLFHDAHLKHAEEIPVRII
jgi:hypothetical protein